MHTTESAPAFSYACGTISAKLSRGERVLLQNVFSSLSSGERLAVIGETGSGKTMLALSILGLLPANVRMQSGCIQMDGDALPSGKQLQTLRGDKLVYIPQNGAEFLLPARTVRKQLYDSLKKLGLPRKAFPALAAEKLRLAGFDAPETILDKYPFQLSGGMAQRVTIALAACSRARLLIADEPTNGLDEAGRAQFLRFWTRFSRMQRSLLLRTIFQSLHAVIGFWCCAAGECWKRAHPARSCALRATRTRRHFLPRRSQTGCSRRRSCARTYPAVRFTPAARRRMRPV